MVELNEEEKWQIGLAAAHGRALAIMRSIKAAQNKAAIRLLAKKYCKQLPSKYTDDQLHLVICAAIREGLENGQIRL